jgi:hypothetical protein
MLPETLGYFPTEAEHQCEIHLDLSKLRLGKDRKTNCIYIPTADDSVKIGDRLLLGASVFEVRPINQLPPLTPVANLQTPNDTIQTDTPENTQVTKELTQAKAIMRLRKDPASITWFSEQPLYLITYDDLSEQPFPAYAPTIKTQLLGLQDKNLCLLHLPLSYCVQLAELGLVADNIFLWSLRNDSPAFIDAINQLKDFGVLKQDTLAKPKSDKLAFKKWAEQIGIRTPPYQTCEILNSPSEISQLIESIDANDGSVIIKDRFGNNGYGMARLRRPTASRTEWQLVIPKNGNTRHLISHLIEPANLSLGIIQNYFEEAGYDIQDFGNNYFCEIGIRKAEMNFAQPHIPQYVKDHLPQDLQDTDLTRLPFDIRVSIAPLPNGRLYYEYFVRFVPPWRSGDGEFRSNGDFRTTQCVGGIQIKEGNLETLATCGIILTQGQTPTFELRGSIFHIGTEYLGTLPQIIQDYLISKLAGDKDFAAAITPNGISFDCIPTMDVTTPLVVLEMQESNGSKRYSEILFERIWQIHQDHTRQILENI